MSNITETQPIITSATVVAFVSAVLVLGVSFGLPITDEQRNAILAVVAIVAPLAVIWWPQRKTTPLANATDIDGEALTRYDGKPPIAEQKAMGLTPTPAPDRGNVV
jgi:cobalamin biosynthesis protein CbiG